MKRYNVLTLQIDFTRYLSGYATTPENSDNIVIDDEILHIPSSRKTAKWLQ